MLLVVEDLLSKKKRILYIKKAKKTVSWRSHKLRTRGIIWRQATCLFSEWQWCVHVGPRRVLFWRRHEWRDSERSTQGVVLNELYNKLVSAHTFTTRNKTKMTWQQEKLITSSSTSRSKNRNVKFVGEVQWLMEMLGTPSPRNSPPRACQNGEGEIYVGTNECSMGIRECTLRWWALWKGMALSKERPHKSSSASLTAPHCRHPSAANEVNLRNLV